MTSPTTPAQALATIAEMEAIHEAGGHLGIVKCIQALTLARSGWTEVERLTGEAQELRSLLDQAVDTVIVVSGLEDAQAKAQSLAEQLAGLKAALYEVDFQCTTVLRGRPRSKQLRALAMTGQVIATMALAGNTKDFKVRQLARQALGEQS